MMSELFGVGVQLALVGMTVVFILLGLLVLATRGASRLARAIERVTAPAITSGAASDLRDLERLAAAAAATHAYRAGLGR